MMRVKLFVLSVVFSFSANAAVSDYLSLLLPPNIAASAFARGAGFWTPADDSSLTGILTDPNSQREDWYQVTPYMGEFWCALSNAGFFYVGVRYQSPAVFLAGLASFVSHTIPRQNLLYLDKAGVALVVVSFLRYANILGASKILG